MKMDQATIDARQAKDEETYRKRTEKALKAYFSRYGIGVGSSAHEREALAAARRGDEWYLAALNRQLVRLKYA